MRGEPLSIDEELVALRFAAEHRVVVDDEAASAFVFLEEDRAASPLIRHRRRRVVHLAVSLALAMRLSNAPSASVSGVQHVQVLPFECR